VECGHRHGSPSASKCHPWGMARKAGSEYWEKPKNVHPAYTEMPPEVVCGAVVERLGLDSRAVQIDGQHWKLETLAQLQQSSGQDSDSRHQEQLDWAVARSACVAHHLVACAHRSRHCCRREEEEDSGHVENQLMVAVDNAQDVQDSGQSGWAMCCKLVGARLRMGHAGLAGLVGEAVRKPQRVAALAVAHRVRRLHAQERMLEPEQRLV